MDLTDKQREAVEAVEKHGSMRAAARALGINYRSLHDRYKAAQKYLEADDGIRDALAQTGISAAAGKHGWRSVKDPETGSFNSVYWSLPKDEAEQAVNLWADTFREALVDAPRSLPTPAPLKVASDMLTRYIVADVHFGMQSWALETGEDYDLKIAANRFAEASGALLDAAPATERALILNTGDTLHNNDQKNMTPASGHILDVDSRFAKIAYEAVKVQVAHIEAAKAKHAHVDVVMLAGNHDPDATSLMAIALMMRFEGDPRVTVHFHPRKLWCWQFGKVLLSAHHGDKTKPERLVMQVADDYAPIWGATHWRYLDTGHIHHDHGKDIGGCYWQAHRTIAGRDAAAAGFGYTSRKTMKAITVHRERGEVLRNTAGII